MVNEKQVIKKAGFCSSLKDNSYDYLSLIKSNVRTKVWSCVDLSRATDWLLVLTQFFPLGNPAWKATHGKHDSEHVNRYSQSSINDTRVEIYVWI